MECPIWRQLCAVGVVLVLVGVHGDSPARAASGWRTLAAGMEIREVETRKQSIVGDSKITVLRMDPSRWELEVIGVLQTGESAGHTAREWSQKAKYAAAINAGMFGTDSKTHLGYLRSRDQVYNGRVNAYQSVMAFHPRESGKVPAFRIFDLDSPGVDLQTILADYTSAVQNLRLIKRPGINQWTKQSREWSEAAVGEDSEGRILFIYSRSPFSMHDLNQELLVAGIGLMAAQHMEGGPEAQLYVHVGETELEMFGSYETSFKENDQNSAAWPVPNVIGARQRATQH
ncbi:MAG TPA: phosphodiester glycosidase family protein [Candidatus Sulfotelmatobacter sp.]|nr:phosphodiester glycosidase family protein [Candidatus Sulfotelmatobacter sp.]